MAGILVYVHHDEGELAPQSLGVLAKAAALGGDVTAFVAGSGLDDSWAGSLGGHGASKVLVADDPALAGGLPQPIVDAIEASAREADAILFGAGVVSADFVRTARAKGLGARLVYGRHALSNALPPLVVLLALSFPGIVAGSVFVESVFAWPGMGRAMVQAISARDYPVVLGATMLYAALVIGANLAADLVLPALDPRRR